MNKSIEQIKQLKELFENEFKPVDGIQKVMSAKDKLLLEIADNMIEELECVRPPLGLRPKFIVDEHRIIEIQEAMKRYDDAGKEIPDEWKYELDVLKGIVFMYRQERLD